MQYQFSDVIEKLQPSFIREIMKLIVDDNIISFAGGLPDPKLFPHEDIKNTSSAMFDKHSVDLFQYSTTEGHPKLRQWIADRFAAAHDIDVSADQVLIVSGSQQALDLFGKIYISPNDGVVMESPSYLGAIQAFRMYSPIFKEVPLHPDGVDIDALKVAMSEDDSKFFYGIPNFQNPTGVTYTAKKRQQVAQLLKQTGKMMLEDDPYGALQFDTAIDKTSEHTLADDADKTCAPDLNLTKPIYALAPDNVAYLGTFSKIFVPGFRIGWVIAPKPIIRKLVIAKQAADLHTNVLVQELIYEYVSEHDIDAHIELIRQTYASKKNCMVEAIETYLGDAVKLYPAVGGMFIWMHVPGVNTLKLLDYAIKENVAFVPGEAFSLTQGCKDYLRLNFTSLDNEQIVTGVKRLQKALQAYRADNG